MSTKSLSVVVIAMIPLLGIAYWAGLKQSADDGEQEISSIEQWQNAPQTAVTQSNQATAPAEQNPKFTHFRVGNRNVKSIFAETDTVWVGTSGGGLDRYDADLDGFVHHTHDPGDPNSLSGDYVNTIYEDRDGALWIGTTTGLNRLDRATGRVTRYQHDSKDPSSLSNDAVFSILEDSEGAFWIGTSGGG